MNKDWLVDRYDDTAAGAAGARDWIGDHVAELLLILVLSFMTMGIWSLIGAANRERADQIALCMRAFERTHDQCEFMVRNHVNP